MRKHPLFFFFLISYAFSWITVIPFLLAEWGVLSGDYLLAFIVKSFGPFLAAYVMIRVTEGREGLDRFRSSFRQLRAGWGWYLFILLGIPGLIVLGIVLQPGTLAGFQGIKTGLLVVYLVNFIVVFFGGGPLGEEPGWRGFALPHMQKRYGPLWGTLLLGVLWTFWHLPDFLSPSAQGGGPGTGLATFLTNFPIFMLMVIALAVLFTWIYNQTRGSIFLAILAHASINTPQLALVPLFPAVSFTHLNLALLIAFGLPALLIVILTRGQLGYRAGTEQLLIQEKVEPKFVH
jgi:membrane protease YdiL (CAAX protease family)